MGGSSWHVALRKGLSRIQFIEVIAYKLCKMLFMLLQQALRVDDICSLTGTRSASMRHVLVFSCEVGWVEFG